MTVTGDPVTLHNGTYLVTWNGHGDALALERLDPVTGTLTVANRFSYSTWGAPTLTLHNGYGDLGFRYRYVGQWGVAWDGYAGADLLYMRARHYSPELGRFLQPDPARAEENPYAYAGNSPVTKADPEGKLFDTLLDLVFVGVSLVAVVADPSDTNKLALAADTAALFLPFVTGAGAAVRLARAAEKAGRVPRLVYRVAGTRGLLHSFDRHASRWFGRPVSVSRDLAQWEGVINRASRSSIRFLSRAEGTETVAHLARIDGKWIIVHFYAKGPRAGELLSAWYVGRNARIRFRR